MREEGKTVYCYNLRGDDGKMHKITETLGYLL